MSKCYIHKEFVYMIETHKRPAKNLIPSNERLPLNMCLDVAQIQTTKKKVLKDIFNKNTYNFWFIDDVSFDTKYIKELLRYMDNNISVMKQTTSFQTKDMGYILLITDGKSAGALACRTEKRE